MHQARHLGMVTAEVFIVTGSVENDFGFATLLLDVVGIEYRPAIRVGHYVEEHRHMIGVDERLQQRQFLDGKLLKEIDMVSQQ
jgi:hypothetical protein